MTSQIRNQQNWDLGCLEVWRRKKVWRFLTQQFKCCTYVARCAGALSCWNTKSLPNTLRVVAYDVIMTSWSSTEEVSKRYHHNFLFCNNNEITACIAELFKSFLWRSVCGWIFKVVQQQTIGKVGNSFTYLWADNFCLQQWKNYCKKPS